MFTVRAENAYGLSVPSNTSEILHTQSGETQGVSQAQLDEARIRLGTRVITLKNLTPTGSTTVRVSWEVSNPISECKLLLLSYNFNASSYFNFIFF